MAKEGTAEKANLWKKQQPSLLGQGGRRGGGVGLMQSVPQVESGGKWRERETQRKKDRQRDIQRAREGEREVEGE